MERATQGAVLGLLSSRRPQNARECQEQAANDGLNGAELVADRYWRFCVAL